MIETDVMRVFEAMDNDGDGTAERFLMLSEVAVFIAYAYTVNFFSDFAVVTRADRSRRVVNS